MCSVCISLCSFNVRKWIAVDVTVRHFCFGRYRENTDSQGVKTAGEYRLPRFLSGCGATLAILLSLDLPVVLRFLAGIMPVLIGRQSEWLALPIRVDVQARFSPYPWLASRHRVVLKIPTLNVLEHKGGGFGFVLRWQDRCFLVYWYGEEIRVLSEIKFPLSMCYRQPCLEISAESSLVRGESRRKAYKSLTSK